MIVYLETSALVKRYVDEPGREETLRALRSARMTATSLLTYVEVRAALARSERRAAFGAQELRTMRRAFESDWSDVSLVHPGPQLVLRAGDLAQELGLRGYDAVHLASAEQLKVHSSGARICFACFDDALNRAARILGLDLLRGA